jgi:hypothetical protein
VHQHGLNPILQRNSARIARPASPSQLEQHHPIVKTPELNIAPIFLNGGPNPRLQQLLDHAHDLAVVLIVAQRIFLPAFLGVLLAGSFLNGIDDLFT